MSAELPRADRLRVTCVICSLALGGAQRNILRLAEGLSHAGHTCTLLTLDPCGPDFYRVPAGIKRVRANPAAFWGRSWLNLPAHWRRFRTMRASILGTRPDVVVSFIDTTNIDVLLALTGAGVPVIVSERVDPRFHSIGAVRRALRWWLYPRAAAVVLVARASEGWARKFVPRWKVVVIDNPVIAPKTLTPYPLGARTILSMGRLVTQKGYDLLVTAFAAVARDHPDWTLRILGEGPERRPIEALVEQCGLEDRVELPGAQDPSDSLSASSFFVLASRYEGFPMALAEAMAAGLPVISFDCPSGPRELVRPEVDGLLVPAQDVNTLIAAMRRLVEDSELRKKFAARAPEVCQRFPLTAYNQAWTRVVQDAAQGAA